MINQTIINTRPKNLQFESNLLFRNAGFEVVELPCIEIVENTDQNTILQLQAIEDNDVIVFTSQFAVQFAYRSFPDLKFSDSNTVIAVGKKSAETLEQNSSVAIWVPEQQNSEGVIELLKGLKKFDKIVMITAAEGRDEIQKFALNREIDLQQINVYQRTVPLVDKEIINSVKELTEFQTLATSVTTLINLKKMLSPKLWQKFLRKELICASERIKNKALKLGFEKAINVRSANIEKIIEALKKTNL